MVYDPQELSAVRCFLDLIYILQSPLSPLGHRLQRNNRQALNKLIPHDLLSIAQGSPAQAKMYSPTPPPPLPPPKPSSHEASRLGTPSISQSPLPRPSPLTESGFGTPDGKGKGIDTDASGLIPLRHDSQRRRQEQQAPQEIPDPGESWLPKFLEDKSYVDLFLTHEPVTMSRDLRSIIVLRYANGHKF